MKTETEILELIETVRQTAYELHVYLGNGYLEKVYENALKNRLVRKGIEVKTQVPLKVHDEDGSLIGDYQADMLVDGLLIVELKAVRAIAAEHFAQTMNYLKTTGLKYALLINFGSYKFEVRRIVSTFHVGGKKPCRDVEDMTASAAGISPTPPSTRSPNLHGTDSPAPTPPSTRSPNLHGTDSPAPTLSSTRSPNLHGSNSSAAGISPTLSSTRSPNLHG